MQVKPIEDKASGPSPLRDGHLSSPSRSCLGRLIFICGSWGALWAKLPHSKIYG